MLAAFDLPDEIAGQLNPELQLGVRPHHRL
jgi:hypothetical protein